MQRSFLAIIFFIFLFSNAHLYSQENLLTLKQQLDRLQREVNDLSKSVFSNGKNNVKQNNIVDDTTVNFSAIDMRIYDLEKDIKKLTMLLEELTFQFDEFSLTIDSLEKNINYQIKQITEQNLKSNLNNEKNLKTLNKPAKNENSLGTINITSDGDIDSLNDQEPDSETKKNLNKNEDTNKILSPDEQFQIILDLIRNKEYEKAKLALNIFIAENEANQLSGSAHYWLGKLFIFEKNHREAAIILLEGVQKYPSSIKASEMLLVLSDSLIEMNKNKEACKILDQLINDYPKSKSAKKVIIKQSEISCSDIFE